MTVARTTARDRHHGHARPRRRRAIAAIDTGIGFYDHLLGSLAHHGLFDLAISADGDLQVDEHHTVEDVALVLGAAFAEALGDRAGIARFGDALGPDGRVARDTRSSTSAAGRMPSSTCRSAASGSAACRSSSSSTPSSRSPGPSGATLHLRGTGRNDHHLAEAAFKALGARPARRLRDRPAPDGRRLDQGRRSE